MQWIVIVGADLVACDTQLLRIVTMMRRRHSMHASMLSTGSLLTPTLPSPTALLTPDFLAAQDLRERSKSPAPANMNLMRSKSPIPLRRCKSPQPPIGRCKSPAPLVSGVCHHYVVVSRTNTGQSQVEFKYGKTEQSSSD